MRFTIRRLMIMVAVLALLLAVGIAVVGFPPGREPTLGGDVGYDSIYYVNGVRVWPLW